MHAADGTLCGRCCVRRRPLPRAQQELEARHPGLARSSCSARLRQRAAFRSPLHRLAQPADMGACRSVHVLLLEGEALSGLVLGAARAEARGAAGAGCRPGCAGGLLFVCAVEVRGGVAVFQILCSHIADVRRSVGAARARGGDDRQRRLARDVSAAIQRSHAFQRTRSGTGLPPAATALQHPHALHRSSVCHCSRALRHGAARAA